MRLGIAVWITSISLAFAHSLPAQATEYVSVSGTLTPPSGFTLQVGGVVVDGLALATISSDGVYQVSVPKGQSHEFVFTTQTYKSSDTLANSIATIANWSSSQTFNSATTLNFQMPRPHQISLSFWDGSNNLIPKVKFEVAGFNPNHSPYVDDSGTSWSGIQYLYENKPLGGGYEYTTNGTANVWLFDTTKFEGFNFAEQGVQGPFVLGGSFSIAGNVDLKLCIPVRFDSSMSLHPSCYPTKLDQAQASTPTASPNVTPSPTTSPSATPSPTATPRPTVSAIPIANSTNPTSLIIQKPTLKLARSNATLNWPALMLSSNFEAAYQYRITKKNSKSFGAWKNLLFQNSLSLQNLSKGAKYSVSIRPLISDSVGKPYSITFTAK